MMLNNDNVAGRIIQRIIDSKHSGKHFIQHGISYNNNPYIIKDIITKYCAINSCKIEELPYGFNLMMTF